MVTTGCGSLAHWGRGGRHEDSLWISLSDGLSAERANVPHGQNWTLRFTLKNHEHRPVRLTGVGVRRSFGDLRFVDAFADTRKSDDREGRVFKGFPPSPKAVGMARLRDVTSTTVRAREVVDVVVGVEYLKGQHAGLDGLTVYYQRDGAKEYTDVDVKFEMCQGDQIDGEGCAEYVGDWNRGGRGTTVQTTVPKDL